MRMPDDHDLHPEFLLYAAKMFDRPLTEERTAIIPNQYTSCNGIQAQAPIEEENTRAVTWPAEMSRIGDSSTK